MVTGDPIEAAALGTQALNWAGTLRSHSAVDDLRARRTEVTELRHHDRDRDR